MFERYSEKARRVVFWARYETGQYGSNRIEPQHLLLGLLRERPELIPRGSEVRKEIESDIPTGPKVSTSTEIPLSEASKRVLRLAEDEANRLGHKRVGTEHILFAMLHEPSSIRQLLNSHGIDLHQPYEDRSVSYQSGNQILNDIVYLLWHIDAKHDEKVIGVYRTRADASAAIERTKDKPGFADAGGRFEIAEYVMNQDHWIEGFERPVD
jgi:ATP-dependent Clp protease ATP-binding subunit ClpA